MLLLCAKIGSVEFSQPEVKLVFLVLTDRLVKIFAPLTAGTKAKIDAEDKSDLFCRLLIPEGTALTSL